MRGHKYEIELGGSRCADLTDKKCPRFISKASAQKQSAPKGGREGDVSRIHNSIVHCLAVQKVWRMPLL